MLKRPAAALVFVSLLSLLLSVTAPGAAQAATSITGAGSTWSLIAVNQWRADVYNLYGLEVNYTGVGSTAGRQFFIENQVDFANSEIPFLPDEVKQLQHENKHYQYLPIVAGGTSTMYNLTIGGQRIRNLQMDWKALLGIFTGNITYWDDPAIKADNGNNGLAARLPHLRIIPVIRSDGSGTSAQFSAWLAYWSGTGAGTTWGKFCAQWGISPCGSTSFWPNFDGSVAQKGSDGVANYVAASTSNGAIGYVEAGFALARNFPVSSVRNESGHYVQPTSHNDSTALTHATFNSDRTQNLTNVYRAPEANAYPNSSYSYMITQTTGFDPAKGKVLGQFILYFACAGQQEAAPLGYAPLPENLVLGDFAAVKAIPGAPAPPPLSECDNPTIPGHHQHNPNVHPGPQQTSGPTGTTGGGGGSKSGTPTSQPTYGPSSTPLPAGTELTAAEVSERQTAVLASVNHVKPEPALPLILAGLDVLVLIWAVPWFLRRRGRRED